MEKIKIAIQKSGRLSEKSIELLKECGIKVSNGDRKLKTSASNFPMEILFLRDDDIPQYVEQGVADIGILGENEVWEKDKEVDVIEKLGFGNCRLSLAIPKDEVYTGQSIMEMREIVRALGAQVAGTVCIVDKSMGRAPVPPPFASLYAIPVKSFQPAACPLCEAGVPLVNQ